MAPDDAILAEAKKGGYDLIIMGVNRRPGEKLFFGDGGVGVGEGAGLDRAGGELIAAARVYS
jgi:hypothetical protein